MYYACFLTVTAILLQLLADELDPHASRMSTSFRGLSSKLH